MGLFSSILHLRDVPRDRLIPALDKVLRKASFEPAGVVAVPAGGPYSIPDHNSAAAAGPCYIVSALKGHWITIIEVREGPQLPEIGRSLSLELSCYTLTIMVHDDDLFFYNLYRDGKSLDGYNSCPQYFEEKRISESEVGEQRHDPEPFGELLPPNQTMDELRALLNRGWWSAHDAGRLDDDGVATDDDGYVFESERMTAFGTLLQLHGEQGDYPYTAWGDSQEINWPTLQMIRYGLKAAT